MSDAWPFGELERGRYGAILADPPWRFKTYNEKGRNRCPDWRTFRGSPSRHYSTLDLQELKDLPVADLCAPDCVLFLWSCWPLLLESIEAIGAWGFTYKTCAFDWTKADVSTISLFDDGHPVQIGCGYWTRSNTEPCLLATRGSPKRFHADVRQAIISPRREHSRKPDGIHERIERLVGGPYCELFARQRRPGWDAWGNETEKFNAR